MPLRPSDHQGFYETCELPPACRGSRSGTTSGSPWGLTVFAIDANHLYVYDLDRTNQSYRYGGWEEFESVSEEIEVRGGDRGRRDRRAPVHAPPSRHLHRRAQSKGIRRTKRVVRVRDLRLFRQLRLHDGRQLERVPRRNVALGYSRRENQVYAEVDRNIGWKPGGRAPIGVGYDGLLPVAGDGRYEWAGFRAGSEFAEMFNLPEGFFATTNQFNPQEDSSSAYEWSNPIRHDRIVEVLSQQSRHSLEDSARLQTDIVNTRAREICCGGRGCEPSDAHW